MSESPILGTLSADSSQPIDVTLEALPGMPEGLYTAYLVVTNDDPVVGALPVTLTMRIASRFLFLPV